jgi:hypothetical protein
VGNQLILFVASVSALAQRGKAEMEVRKAGKWSTHEVSVMGNIIVINNAQDVEKVRYAYANYPTCTLFNEFGAPLAPFEMEIE